MTILKQQYNLNNKDLEKLHNIELELLEEFDRICKKYNINYSIDGGTLLGAIRHNGFIPWDDDADVIMLRAEYNKFIKACKSELDCKKYYIQDMNNTHGYRWGYAKLRKKNTKFVRLNQEHMPYEQGVFLDVFICDYVPNNYILRAICNFHSFIYRKILWSAVARKQTKGLKKLFYELLYKIPEDKLKRRYNRYVNFRNRTSTDWVKCLTFPACNNVFGYKKEWYVDTCDIEFENIILKGSKKWDEYLSFLYGDYMSLPPVEKRKIHPVSEFQIK